MAKPFLRWAGGKRQLLHEILPRIPKEFNRYHEPMLGGGAVFFALKEAGKPGISWLGDMNKDLIRTYRAIQKEITSVITYLSEYAALPQANTAGIYYQIRDTPAHELDSLGNAEFAARFIYLNRTNYNGLYRVNKSGRYNVPFGHLKNPKICDTENLRAVNIALDSSVSLRVEDYKAILDVARAGDFVYFDPPYAPVSPTADFTAFTAGGFGDELQQELAQTFRELDKKGVYTMLSNSDTPFTRQLYSEYNVETVYARRNINRVGSKRGKVPEILVRNYAS